MEATWKWGNVRFCQEGEKTPSILGGRGEDKGSKRTGHLCPNLSPGWKFQVRGLLDL